MDPLRILDTGLPRASRVKPHDARSHAHHVAKLARCPSYGSGNPYRIQFVATSQS
jgi:hypothetical protein